MSTDGTPPPIMLPAISVILLAEVLTELDEFLRSAPVIAADLAGFLGSRGHTHARFSASNGIDDVSFTAAHLRAITSDTGKLAAEYACLAGYMGDDPQDG